MIGVKKTGFRLFCDYAIPLAGTALLTGVIQSLNLSASAGNLSMIYLFLVIAVAVFLGRGPAVLASVSSFLAVNWFFVSPRYTFNVGDPLEWLSLCAFLFTATVTGQLMAQLRSAAFEAKQHEQEAAVLSEASWAVASQLETRSALQEVLHQAVKIVAVKSATVIAIVDGIPTIVVAHPESGVDVDLVTAAEVIGLTKNELASGSAERLFLESFKERNGVLYIPLVSSDVLGVLCIKPEQDYHLLTLSQLQIVDSLVSHSTVILQRDNLFRTKAASEALAEADKLKTALLSMVSHDFRSPLTSIKASVSTLLAKGKPLEDESKRALYQTIDQETDRLNGMVGNILDLSRLECNAWRPKLEPTPVAELIGMALNVFSADANKRIKVVLDHNLPEISVDCVQMTQVLKNLVENSLKYSTGLVEVSSALSDSYACITVADRGRGLKPGECDLIFEPFYRSADLKETSVPGVGIGLAVSRGLVEAHGGKLVAENRPGGGAVFLVTLPIVQSEDLMT